MNELYKRIEAAALRRGMTPSGAAEKAGISRGRISDLKTGKSETMLASTVKKLADALGVSFEYLMYGEDNSGRVISVNLDKKMPELRHVFAKFTERELVYWISEMTAELQRRKVAEDK